MGVKQQEEGVEGILLNLQQSEQANFIVQMVYQEKMKNNCVNKGSGVYYSDSEDEEDRDSYIVSD